MWESNPPMIVLVPQLGFEDLQGHQTLSTPIVFKVTYKVYYMKKNVSKQYITYLEVKWWRGLKKFLEWEYDKYKYVNLKNIRIEKKNW